jgi:hypothetical protein
MRATKYQDLKPITEEHGGLILNNIYRSVTPNSIGDSDIAVHFGNFSANT